MQPKSSTVSISSLLISPPEETPYASFDHGPQSSTAELVARSAHQPSSPPASPCTTASHQAMTSRVGSNAADPIIFPGEPTGATQPLFSSPVDSVIDSHIAARTAEPLSLPSNVKPPTREEYELVGSFVRVYPQWVKPPTFKTGKEWSEYLKQQVADARADDKARREYRASQAFKNEQLRAQANPIPRSSACRPKPSTNRPLRPNSCGSPSNSSNVMLESATGPRNSTKVTKLTSSRTGRPTAAPMRLDFDHQSESATQPRKMAKKMSSKSSKSQVSDTKFDHIPDYCPPLSSLDHNKMTFDSTKKPREFTEADKPLLHLLHPEEQELARREQLSAASYMTTKRRIFVDRLYFYHWVKEQRAEQERLGKKEKPFVKQFLKTHAQEAAKIDVNKTSRLHAAFDSVGWFEEKWCERFEKPTFDNKQDRSFSAEDIQKHGLPGPQKHFKRGVS